MTRRVLQRCMAAMVAAKAGIEGAFEVSVLDSLG
jgi:hypothetical protein